MICFHDISPPFQTEHWPDLVVNICNIHHKVDIVAEVISHNPSENILRDIIPIYCQLA